MAKSMEFDLTDAQLAQGVLDGREELFEVLYRRHENEVFAMAYAILKDVRDARDVVTQTFTAIRGALARFDPTIACYRTWQYRIAERLTLNALRARRRARARYCRLDDTPVDRLPSIPDPASLYEQRRVRDRVRSAMMRLPPAQREPVELYFFGELTKTEIARRLGKSEHSIRAALERALKNLRPLLADLRKRRPVLR